MPSIVPRTALPGSSQSLHDRFATGLAYFSIALGLAELAMPRLICRATGLQARDRFLVRAYGGREIATGLAILASHDATPWVWARVAGDTADVATVAACADDAKRIRTLAAFAFLAATSAADAFCAIGLSSEKGGRNSALADYRDRSGFPRGVEAMRGAARDFRPASVSTRAEGAYLMVRPRPA